MLYFGSFNPIHKGHVAIAEFVLDEKLADEVWFVVSPKNPLKNSDILIDECDRLEMVRLAIAGSRYPERLKASDIEFALPKPSYTIDTLRVLQQTYPGINFSLLFGSDITGQFHLWKEGKSILENFNVFVYPRSGYANHDLDNAQLLAGAPYFDYSSTEIRDALRDGREIREMLPPHVYDYIKKKRLWM